MRRLRPRSLSTPGRLAALSAGLFLLLSGLVWAGVFTALDRYAVGHLMPWGHPAPSHRLIQVTAVFKPQIERTSGGSLVSLWTYPASPFISGLIVLGAAGLLERRGARWPAAAVIVLWIAANAIELAGKLIIRRPSIGVGLFANSFPSGHTVRAFVVAAVLAWTWRRAAVPALAWAVGVALALVAIGDHVPTDVVGGALLAGALVGLLLHVDGHRPERLGGERLSPPAGPPVA